MTLLLSSPCITAWLSALSSNTLSAAAADLSETRNKIKEKQYVWLCSQRRDGGETHSLPFVLIKLAHVGPGKIDHVSMLHIIAPVEEIEVGKKEDNIVFSSAKNTFQTRRHR